MTYSIVVRHPESGKLGVAVQSHYFASGSQVAFAEHGVGAVATQATVNFALGPLGLIELRANRDPETALGLLLEQDPGADNRQVALIDRHGKTAAYTGRHCIEFDSHINGDGWSCQGNMLAQRGIPEAMSEAWLASVDEGLPIELGLLAALDAAEVAGGDIRGRQSAAIKVVDGEPSAERRAPIIDLRVDDHPTPLIELRRLVMIGRAYRQAEKLVLTPDVTFEDLETIRKSWNVALGDDNPELDFWLARELENAGRDEEAERLYAMAADVDPNWSELRRRLDAAGR